MTKEKTTITVDKDVAKDFMLFKIQTNAKNLNSILKDVIVKLKGELKEDNKSETAVETSDASTSSTPKTKEAHKPKSIKIKRTLKFATIKVAI